MKVGDGPPEDDPADLTAPVWAGVLPLALQAGEPVDAPDLQVAAPAAPVVAPAIAALADKAADSGHM